MHRVFPFELDVPLNTPIMVNSSLPGEGGESNSILLTEAAPERDIEIGLHARTAPPPSLFKYEYSLFPQNNGFLPIHPRYEGTPDVSRFEIKAYAHDGKGLVAEENNTIFLIDVNGDVWRWYDEFRSDYGRPVLPSSPAFHFTGRIDPETFATMVALISEASSTEPVVLGESCGECPGSFLFASAPDSTSRTPILLGRGMSNAAHRINPAADRLAPWILSIELDSRPSANPWDR